MKGETLEKSVLWGVGIVMVLVLVQNAVAPDLFSKPELPAFCLFR